MPAIYAPTVFAGSAGGAEPLLFAAAIVGGFSLLFYGVDVARGGRHFEADADVERAIAL